MATRAACVPSQRFAFGSEAARRYHHHTTAEHPFFAKGKGWTPAHELKPSDQIRLMEPGWVTVEEVEDTGRIETVYNLEVEHDHTYFVGCDEWGFSVWSHNEYGKKVGEAFDERLANLDLKKAGLGGRHDVDGPASRKLREYVYEIGDDPNVSKQLGKKWADFWNEQALESLSHAKDGSHTALVDAVAQRMGLKGAAKLTEAEFAAAVSQAFPNFYCTDTASLIVRGLGPKSQAEVVKLLTPQAADPVITAVVQSGGPHIQIALNNPRAHHVAVKIGDLMYDNHFRGVPQAEWMANFGFSPAGTVPQQFSQPVRGFFGPKGALNEPTLNRFLGPYQS